MWGSMRKSSVKDTINQLKNASLAQDELILKIQTKKKYKIEGCDPIIDFTTDCKVEFSKDIFIRDLSTDEQTKLGLSIFHITVNKTTLGPVHTHDERSQLIYVKKGYIYDNVSQIRFEKGESFFLSKKNSHALKYMKDSELIITYLPGLEVV